MTLWLCMIYSLFLVVAVSCICVLWWWTVDIHFVQVVLRNFLKQRYSYEKAIHDWTTIVRVLT